MAYDNSLPFERGVTWKDGNTASTAVPNVNMAGRVFPTGDDESVVGKGHNSAIPIKLVVLANRSGGNVTLSRTGLRFSTLTSTTPYTAVNGAAAVGARGFIPDDRYTSGQVIANGDLFYGVKEGIARARMSTRGGNIAVNDSLSFTTGSKLRKVATSAVVIAQAMEACTTENVSKNVNVIGSPFRLHS